MCNFIFIGKISELIEYLEKLKKGVKNNEKQSTKRNEARS